jgi:RelE toxin of RelE / RelB toxin-antitoxin system
VKIVPTRGYMRHAAKLFSETERRATEDMIAADPEHWPVIPGTGGLRKARVSRPGMGKRGGARTIYFYWAGETLILRLHVYAKNAQEDIDTAQRKVLVQLRDQFMEDYRD